MNEGSVPDLSFLKALCVWFLLSLTAAVAAGCGGAATPAASGGPTGGGTSAAAPRPKARAAASVHVSPSGSDSSGNGSASAPYATIAHAIARAGSGGTVILEPGTYRTMVTITAPVILESDASGSGAAAATVIDASGQPHGIVIRGAGAAGTTIRGLTVENASDIGILVQDTSRITIAGDRVIHNAIGHGLTGEHKGIQLEGVSDSTVEDNTVTGNAHGGIRLSDSATRPATGNTITGNTIRHSGTDCGIVISSGYAKEGVSGNTISHNDVSLNPIGIVLAGRLNESNQVLDNKLTGNFAAGLTVHANAPHDTNRGNIIKGNTFSGNGHGPASVGLVIAANVTPVLDTTVSGNTFSQEHFGIWEDRANGTAVSGNTYATSVQVPVQTSSAPGDMPAAPKSSTGPAGKPGPQGSKPNASNAG
jgi:parallel beta-helix repeat protein